ncbi:lipopolysaccharide assembly protein LapB [Geobacter sp.]|uniref:tetratricopeptide repeat protein n=1 Tax=Geobacter sp. TaxID=46610 RepID=UPI0027BABC18|nr:tetratricopeptide repeat protein [Geobacter sp.]
MNQPLARNQKIDYLLLILLTVGIYARTLGHEFQMSWDDNWYIVYNDSIQGFSWQNLKTIFSSIYQANYAPLQMLSYMVDYSLWGLQPGAFALTNFVFHALNGVLVYRLLFSLHGERLLALVAAAFFLAHPLQVESVAWISCRKNVLSLFFFLLSWEAYRCYRTAEAGRGRWAYFSSLAAFLLSLMAKSTTLVLPVILVLYDLCFPEAGRHLRLKDKIPYALAALVFALVSMHVQQHDFQGGIREPYHGGSPLATFYTMLPVFCLYLWRLVWPAGLSAIYDPLVHAAPDGVVLAAGLLLAALAWGGYRLFKYDRRLGFWLLFFWIGLLPFAQIVPIYWLITDRYINVSIIGAAALAGAGAVFLRSWLGARGAPLLYLAVTVWIAALSVASFQRVGVWRNSLTLWSDAVAKLPNTPRIWEHYAEALLSSGQADASRRAYEHLLASQPTNVAALAGLGDLYTVGGELDKGMTLLNRLLAIKPDHVIGWASLGTNYLKRGNYAEAERAYLRAQSLQPEAWQVMVLLGDLAQTRGDAGKARQFYEQAEARIRGNAEIAYKLACIEAMAGDLDAAITWLEKAVQRGYANAQSLADDEQLAALWQDPRFYHLLERYSLQ